MKNSYELEQSLGAEYQYILNCDKMEIDNPNRHYFLRLSYLDRIQTIIREIKKRAPDPTIVTVAEFGCAQGNMSLLLAEAGYRTIAIDIDPLFLEYSKRKHERGDVQWIKSGIDQLRLPENSLDIAILGEVVEHCAYPEDIIENIFRYLKLGGLLIITTPNGARLKTGLQTFSKFSKKEQRKIFESKQFGPAGPDHLFLFRLDELDLILPSDAHPLSKGYLGSTIVINRYTYQFFKWLPVHVLERSIRALAQLPIFNALTFNNIYVVVGK
jgi:SAM-dependent methyltransferase